VNELGSNDAFAAAPDATAPGSLTIVPPAPAWRGMVHHRTDERAMTFRRELSLPTDRPVIMTGHQAEFWHPGIAAKYIAADAAARALGGAAAWIVVDQDPQERTSVRYPARDADGGWTVRAVEFSGAGASHTAVHEDVPPFVRDGMERIEACFEAFGGEPRLAARVALATGRLLEPYRGRAGPPTVIYASELWRTTLMNQLVERMRSDPERASATYNAAARRHPRAGIRELLVNEVQDVYELPLWRLTPEGERVRVYAEMLDSVPREQLAPRALFMTGLLRLAGCDLFIHGTGGGGEREGYDRVMEEWLASWLGEGGASGDGREGGRGGLAPMTVVTATRVLPLADAPPPSRAEIASAVWRAHHARHDPAMAGDHGRAAQKKALVKEIAAIGWSREKAVRGARAEKFEQLQDLLTAYREEHREWLLNLAADAGALHRRADEAEIVGDRTWAFPLYPGSAMASLREEIGAAFGLAGTGEDGRAC
jgi:hypothetical protein